MHIRGRNTSGLLNDRPAVTGSSHFRENGRTAAIVVKNLQLIMPIIKCSPALVSYFLVFNLPIVLCNAYVSPKTFI